jgi:hypothetical protein
MNGLPILLNFVQNIKRFITSKINIEDAYIFLKEDYKSFPLRFIVESVCWFAVVINTILLTMTVPNVPWLICYPIWIIACLFGIWTSYTRKYTVGILSCSLYAIIDAAGLYRVLIQ